MSYKILVIDDSSAIRSTIVKALKSYQCEPIEATNGVEGFADAQRQMPDLILLDATMPVMDGAETLSKLNSVQATKNIPVLMLLEKSAMAQAERFKRFGTRGYIGKPFKEDSLINQIRQVVPLQPRARANAVKKKSSDGIDILVLENKPAILKQLEDNLGKNNWTVHGAGDASAAMEYCNNKTPDLAMMSVTMPENGALDLFRFMRSNDKLKYVPTYGMAVKTAENEIAAAKASGITDMVTKPIDFKKLEMKIVNSLNLDVSDKYFKLDDEALILTLPNPLTSDDIKQAKAYLKPQISEAVDNGLMNVIIDMTALEGVDMDLIEVLVDALEMIDNLGLKSGLVGNDIIIGECSGIEDSTEWEFFESIEEAKSGM